MKLHTILRSRDRAKQNARTFGALSLVAISLSLTAQPATEEFSLRAASPELHSATSSPDLTPAWVDVADEDHLLLESTLDVRLPTLRGSVRIHRLPAGAQLAVEILDGSRRRLVYLRPDFAVNGPDGSVDADFYGIDVGRWPAFIATADRQSEFFNLDIEAGVIAQMDAPELTTSLARSLSLQRAGQLMTEPATLDVSGPGFSHSYVWDGEPIQLRGPVHQVDTVHVRFHQVGVDRALQCGGAHTAASEGDIEIEFPSWSSSLEVLLDGEHAVDPTLATALQRFGSGWKRSPALLLATGDHSAWPARHIAKVLAPSSDKAFLIDSIQPGDYWMGLELDGPIHVESWRRLQVAADTELTRQLDSPYLGEGDWCTFGSSSPYRFLLESSGRGSDTATSDWAEVPVVLGPTADSRPESAQSTVEVSRRFLREGRLESRGHRFEGQLQADLSRYIAAQASPIRLSSPRHELPVTLFWRDLAALLGVDFHEIGIHNVSITKMPDGLSVELDCKSGKSMTTAIGDNEWLEITSVDSGIRMWSWLDRSDLSAGASLGVEDTALLEVRSPASEQAGHLSIQTEKCHLSWPRSQAIDRRFHVRAQDALAVAVTKQDTLYRSARAASAVLLRPEPGDVIVVLDGGSK